MMGDAEHGHPSKKRAAGREISRDNPGLDDEDEGRSDQDIGTFKRASDEVLASRRIVKVRRNQTSSTPASNPFAGLRLVPAPDSIGPTSAVTGETKSHEIEVKIDASKEANVENNADNKQLESEADEGNADKIDHDVENRADDKQLEGEADESKDEASVDMVKNDGEVAPCPVDEKDAEVNKVEDDNEKDLAPENTEKEVEKNAVLQTPENENKENDGNQNVEKNGETTALSSFQQLSSRQNAFTGLAGTGFSGSSFSFGSITKDGSPATSLSESLFGLKGDQSSFGFGLSNNGSSPLFGTSGASGTARKQVSLETGEENEKPAFVADSVLFEFIDGTWKERGKGELKVNVSATGTGKARLIMRTRGNYRLILNASLYTDIKLTNMHKKGITFACVNSAGEGAGGLSTFALKFKDVSLVDEFRLCVMEHKGKVAPATLKTPENSPRASDE